jgi:hypothetical protein
MKYLLTIMALLPLYALSQVSENFESGTSGSWQMSETRTLGSIAR